MSFNALIFVYVSSCTFPLMFVKYNTADSQSFNRISGLDRMTVEIFHDQTSTKECC